MRCVVLGHSGTAGFGLDSQSHTWPALLQERLNASGGGWEVTSVPLHPAGPRAVDYAVSRVEAASPDLVILSLNAYPCAVSLVSASVRHRFGARAERIYVRAESRVTRGRVSQPRPVAPDDGFARRWARRILGARTITSPAEVGGVYDGILRRLAQFEGIQVAVLAEALFSDSVRARVPEVERRVREMQAIVRPVADERRFLWCDAATWLIPDKGYWHSDGIHLSALGNERYAQMLAESLPEQLLA